MPTIRANDTPEIGPPGIARNRSANVYSIQKGAWPASPPRTGPRFCCHLARLPAAPTHFNAELAFLREVCPGHRTRLESTDRREREHRKGWPLRHSYSKQLVEANPCSPRADQSAYFFLLTPCTCIGIDRPDPEAAEEMIILLAKISRLC